MDFETMLAQVIAVSLYLNEGGRYDHKRNQHQYFLGYAVCLPLYERKRYINSGKALREQITCLKRMPKIYHGAFKEIVQRFGLLKVATYTINHYQKELKKS